MSRLARLPGLLVLLAGAVLVACGGSSAPTAAPTRSITPTIARPAGGETSTGGVTTTVTAPATTVAPSTTTPAGAATPVVVTMPAATDKIGPIVWTGSPTDDPGPAGTVKPPTTADRYIFARYNFVNMRNGMDIRVEWSRSDGSSTVFTETWDAPEHGSCYFLDTPGDNLRAGTYRVAVYVDGVLVQQSSTEVRPQ